MPIAKVARLSTEAKAMGLPHHGLLNSLLRHGLQNYLSRHGLQNYLSRHGLQTTCPPWPPELPVPPWPPELPVPPWPPELPVPPWPPELPVPPWPPELPVPPWPPELPVLPWLPKLPDMAWRPSICQLVTGLKGAHPPSPAVCYEKICGQCVTRLRRAPAFVVIRLKGRERLVIITMAFIQEESEDFRIEEVYSLKCEDTDDDIDLMALMEESKERHIRQQEKLEPHRLVVGSKYR
ncbi:hypothetical protein QQF64_035873 [Cirrhinus molitorella]|uniref:Uncharacterized protein n=1 Tax=Cirrhinus molitorella TaxID=172907 RepID=A0ABR3NHZ6_9TELE